MKHTDTTRQHTRKDTSAVGKTVPGDKELGAYLKAIGCPIADEYVEALRAGDLRVSGPLFDFLASIGDPNADSDANVREMADVDAD